MLRSMLPTEEREISAMGAASLHTARQAVAALSFIFRDAARAEVSPELLTAALSAASHMSPGAKQQGSCVRGFYNADGCFSSHPHMTAARASLASFRRELCMCNKGIPIETTPSRRGG
jgi:hypothetical protein